MPHPSEQRLTTFRIVRTTTETTTVLAIDGYPREALVVLADEEDNWHLHEPVIEINELGPAVAGE